MSISNYAEVLILDKFLRNVDFTITTVYVSLHTADPGETGASEVSGGSYARQACAFDAAASGATANSALETFSSMPAVTVTHAGLWDAASSGNFLMGGALATSKVLNSGDTFEIAIGDLDVTLD